MYSAAMNDPNATNDWVGSAQSDYDALRFVTNENPCPYIPGHQSRSEVYHADGLGPDDYTQLLARGFRRSGHVVYRPRCRGCCECKQLRVDVNEFTPTRSMRRVRRRNADVRVEPCAPVPTREKHILYTRYLAHQHDGAMSAEFDAYVEFLYDSPFETVEFVYRIGDRIVGVSLADGCADGLSSVYMYFDPDQGRRSLGTFSILWEIDECRRRGLHYYYLGYFVAGCRTMAYKSRFRPNQVLVANRRWVRIQTQQSVEE